MLPDAASWARYAKTGKGPWNHNEEMSAYVDFVFLTSALTFISGIGTILLVRGAGQRWLGIAACILSVMIAWYHFPLID